MTSVERGLTCSVNQLSSEHQLSACCVQSGIFLVLVGATSLGNTLISFHAALERERWGWGYCLSQVLEEGGCWLPSRADGSGVSFLCLPWDPAAGP